MAKTGGSPTANYSVDEQRISTTNYEAHQLKYTGVRKRKWGKYVSEIRLPNCRDRIWLGSYDTAEKAARAFDAALFCLRGPNAKFNFPDDPPNIAGGELLTPAEILTVAQQYASDHYTSSCNNDHPTPPPMQSGGDGVEFRARAHEDIEMEDTSPSSNSDGDQAHLNSIDWSFLDMLNYSSNGGTGDDGGTSGHVSDFGLFPEPGDDVYIPQHFALKDDDDDDHGNGNVPSFLWNF